MTSNDQHVYLRARVEAVATMIPMLDLSFRSMFGGVMIYAAGKPLGSLSEGGLGIKLGTSDREALLREPGAAPVQHDGEAPSKQYVIVPQQIIADDEQLALWLQKSADFVASIPNRPRKKPNRGS